MASRTTWRARQRLMNTAVRRLGIKGYAPLIVDGKPGPATRTRIKHLKWFLGYTKNRTSSYSSQFHDQLKALWSRKERSVKTIHRGKARVKAHNRAYAKSHAHSHTVGGVGYYEGKAVAAWWVPKLQWARAHGWQGHLNSGYRTPAYSEHLCYVMCGRPSCPGRCAGRNTNHARLDTGHAAVDVSDYYTFARLMRVCPIGPRCYNVLGAADPVHFSPTGR